MKNFDYYQTIKSPYFNRSDFSRTTWVSGGKVFASKVGDGDILYADGSPYPIDEKKILHAMKKVVEKDDAAFLAAIKPYKDEKSKLYDEFKADLFADLGIETNPKKEKLFSKAWEDGHSSGYGEVYSCALDLVDLIKD
jgi:hypothetical protein